MSRSNKAEVADKILSSRGSIIGRDLDWSKIIDQENVTKILGSAVRSKFPGRKPLTNSQRAHVMDALAWDDFSEEPFIPTFKALKGLNSLKGLGIDGEELSALLDGTTSPSIEHMQEIARFFRRHPSYFLEYRIMFIINSLNDFLEHNPSVASTWFVKSMKAATK